MWHVEVFGGPLFHTLYTKTYYIHTILVDICILITGRLGVGRKLLRLEVSHPTFGADRGSFSSYFFVDVVC